MGEYYAYVSVDRREYFTVGILGLGYKFSSVGTGLGARALGLLLLGPASEGSCRGRWAGTRIAVIGDEAGLKDAYGVKSTSAAEPGRDLWRAVQEEFANIELDVVSMLLDDGKSTEKILEQAKDDVGAFNLLCRLAHGSKKAAHLLSEHFGADWKKTRRSR